MKFHSQLKIIKVWILVILINSSPPDDNFSPPSPSKNKKRKKKKKIIFPMPYFLYLACWKRKLGIVSSSPSSVINSLDKQVTWHLWSSTFKEPGLGQKNSSRAKINPIILIHLCFQMNPGCLSLSTVLISYYILSESNRTMAISELILGPYPPHPFTKILLENTL